MELGRRQLLRMMGAIGVVAVVPQAAFQASARAATRLSGASYQGKFTKALPKPARFTFTTKKTSVTVDATQFTQQVLTGFPKTRLYGYGIKGKKASWPGPTIEATTGKTVHITWRNRLPTGTKKLTAKGGHLLPVDATLLDAAVTALPAGQKPLVTHLHGSHAEWESDGYPMAWITQSGRKGSMWMKAVSTYDNTQTGGTLWYHDHTMGITRLNVYAGLAGTYVLRDQRERDLIAAKVLPATRYERELIIQDRAFTDDGQLFMQTETNPGGGIEPSVFYDFVTVNGVPWPVLDVQPRKYRLRLVNGSDSRMYVLKLSNGKPFLVIGNDLGLLRTAVNATTLPLAPGERYDVIVDFTGMKKGTTVTVTNAGIDGSLMGFTDAQGNVSNRPSGVAFGDGLPVNKASTALVLRFRVRLALAKGAKGSVRAGTILGAPLTMPKVTNTRKLIIFRGTDGRGRDMEMLGTLAGGTFEWMDKITEVVKKGATEVWEIHNTSLVAHPIHLHLVHFKVLDRAPFTFSSTPMPMADGGSGAMVTVTGTGSRRSPETYERGPKDTVICYPGEITRLVATFDRKGNYVWHCHELHHEDHDMMRPLQVK